MDFGWGWYFSGYGSTSAIVSGNIIASNHSVPLDDGTGRVRYYLDRIDVSDPSSPKMLPAINIPGQLSYFDAAQNVLLTLDYDLETAQAEDWYECNQMNPWSSFDNETSECRTYSRILNSLTIVDGFAVRMSRAELDKGNMISRSVAISSDRVFVSRVEHLEDGSYDYSDTSTWPTEDVLTFNIASGARLQRIAPVLSPEPRAYWGSSRIVARGARAFLVGSNTMYVIDTTVPTAPEVVVHDMPGWYCSSLEVQGDRAYCAMGMQGVLTIDL